MRKLISFSDDHLKSQRLTWFCVYLLQNLGVGVPIPHFDDLEDSIIEETNRRISKLNNPSKLTKLRIKIQVRAALETSIRKHVEDHNFKEFSKVRDKLEGLANDLLCLVNDPDILVAYIYFNRMQYTYKSLKKKPLELNERTVLWYLVICLRLANKFVQDRQYSASNWAKCIPTIYETIPTIERKILLYAKLGIENLTLCPYDLDLVIKTLNNTEKDFAMFLDFKFNITPEEYEIARLVFEEFMENQDKRD